MIQNLEAKLRYVMSNDRRGRSFVHEAIADIEKFGELALIGGAIRDIALFGNRGFKSDFDLVIDPTSKTDFLSFLERKYGITEKDKNKYGGYSLPLEGNWPIDIWILEETWAAKERYVEVNTFSDLLKTTFFQTDAVIYELSSQKLVPHDTYYSNIQRKILELNLKKSPNLEGNIARAFRYAKQKGFSWGRELSLFVKGYFNDIDSSLSKFKENDKEEVMLCFHNNGGMKTFLLYLDTFLNTEEISFFPYADAKKRKDVDEIFYMRAPNSLPAKF